MYESLSRKNFLNLLADRDYVLFKNIELDWQQATTECESLVIKHPEYWTSLIPDQVEAWDELGKTYQSSLHNSLTWGYNQHNTKSWETTARLPKLVLSWEQQCIKQLPISQGIARPTCQPPGNSMPWHVDSFILWKRDNLFSEFVIRFIIFHEDWKKGQILQAGDSPITNWKAGDAVTWHPDRWHLSGNSGIENKWTTAVTGILQEEILVDAQFFI